MNVNSGGGGSGDASARERGRARAGEILGEAGKLSRGSVVAEEGRREVLHGKVGVAAPMAGKGAA